MAIIEDLKERSILLLKNLHQLLNLNLKKKMENLEDILIQV